jgi:hypothetical protein
VIGLMASFGIGLNRNRFESSPIQCNLKSQTQKVMKRVLFILALSALLLPNSACRRVSFGIEDGVYSGNFTVKYPLPYDTTITGSVSVSFENGIYSSTGNDNYVPASAYGSFTLDGDTIYFQDSTGHTANFDGNLVLQGNYAVDIRGNELTFWKTRYGNPEFIYEYRLARE